MKNKEQLLSKECIQTSTSVTEWKKAVEVASQPLLKLIKIEPQYVQAMIDSVEKNGPYMVIADHLALMHARPEDGVIEQGISLLVVSNPIDMEGKPVKIFLVLAAKDNESHLESLQEVMSIFMEETSFQTILHGDKKKIFKLFK